MDTNRAALLFLFFLPPFFHACNATAAGLRQPKWRRELETYSGSGLYETRYFTQTLDHFNFNPQSYAKFQQRYLVNHTYWGGKGSPIFVYTGNEGGIELFAKNTGFMFDIAPSFKALLVFIEHRYYGESIPFGGEDVAYSNASTLGYLCVTQAIADFAMLIIDLKKNLTSEDSPVVAFGGSYGGMLAAWFRLKYPHVVLGALASSAPLLQFDDLVSPYTFYNIVTNDFRSESESCYRTIKSSWKELDDTLSRPGGPKKLAKAFKTCSDEVSNLPQWIEEALVYGAMTDYPTVSDFLTPLPAYPVKQMCKAIDDPISGNDTFARLYGAMNIYYNYTGKATCFDVNTDSLDDTVGTDGWNWQSCTEMILPTGGRSEESMFPANKYSYDDNAGFCESYYGVAPRPHWITTEFGGHDITRVLKRFGSNIIFFNGLRDPWSGGGVLKSLNPSLKAMVVPQGAHHVDLRYSTKEDPMWLQNVRRKEINIIAGWTNQFYADSKL
ncbi:uncharacterized protein LOC103971287 [Musa acuminata AAA Group]|uniref:uncharacterized protein LOC103971287 n=1 Tax=Musa acuminata AAA Group TaxID=214697 RepID=UPI0031D5405E